MKKKRKTLPRCPLVLQRERERRTKLRTLKRVPEGRSELVYGVVVVKDTGRTSFKIKDTDKKPVNMNTAKNETDLSFYIKPKKYRVWTRNPPDPNKKHKADAAEVFKK